MITGRSFSSETIHEKELKSLKEFYASDNPILSDGIAYYSILFRQYLYRNADKKFTRLEEQEQNRIIQKELNEFEAAMRYSFNKGHQTAFSVLLMSTKNNQGYESEYFERPDALNNFLYTFDQTISKDVFEDNISRDANDTLINYTRRNFENGYKTVMAFGKIFFKKGASVAFEQIRKDIVGVDYAISGYSKMLKVPYNQEFEVTPAFKAQFCLESLQTRDYEEWDLFWDATYDSKFADQLVAKVLIHKLNVGAVKQYASVEAPAYRIFVEQSVTNNLDDSEEVYFAEINFLLFDPQRTVRLLESAEYEAIKVALASTLTRKLKVDSQHIFIAD